MIKKILITGGNGFIGVNLAQALLMAGHEVYIFDNYSSSDSGKVQMYSERMNRLQKENPGSKLLYVKGDIENQEDLNRGNLMWGKLDEIYHLACPASPPYYQLDPVKTIMTNVIGTDNILKLAKRHNARVVFTSTSEVYGDPKLHPQPEFYLGDVNCYGIRSCYDEGKRTAESLCYTYRTKYRVDVRIVRIFNTYGPGMDPEDGRVVTNFIKQAINDEDITIYGNGSTTRSFCYVDDMVEGLIRAMDCCTILPKPHLNEASTVWDGSPINLGNDTEVTLKTLCEIIRDEIVPNTKSNIKYLKRPMDDPQKRQPVLTKARHILGYKTKVGLSEGLKSTYRYIKTVMEYKGQN